MLNKNTRGSLQKQDIHAADHFWSFAGCCKLGIGDEWLDMIERLHSGGNAPGQTEEGADEDHDDTDEQIDVIADPFLHIHHLPVGDHHGNQMVHVNEHDDQNGGQDGECDAPRRVAAQIVHQPPAIRVRRMECSGHVEFHCRDAYDEVQQAHHKHCNDDREVRDRYSYL